MFVVRSKTLHTNVMVTNILFLSPCSNWDPGPAHGFSPNSTHQKAPITSAQTLLGDERFKHADQLQYDVEFNFAAQSDNCLVDDAHSAFLNLLSSYKGFIGLNQRLPASIYRLRARKSGK